MEQNPAGFASEDEEATYCLSLLRDGDRQQKIVARERLSQIFEQRGLLDEAAQCLESNIREGIRDPRVYQRLAGVYRRQGRHELADEVLLEARRLAERMQRGPQQGGRRGPGGRPARGGPPPVPGVQDVSTRQLPSQGGPPPGLAAAAGPGGMAAPGSAPGGAPLTEPDMAAARTPRSTAGGPGAEFDFDGPDAFGGPQRGPAARTPTGPPPDRPWWLSPVMVVLLILFCGPYGLAMMWVRGNYPLKARKTAIGVWAGLVVLFAAAAAVFGQQVIRQQLSIATPGGLPGVGGMTGLPAAPTPIVFPPASGAQVGTPAASKPVLPPGGPGAAPSPPTVAGGSLGTPSGVTISPPGSPGPSASPSTSAPAEKPSAGSPPAPKPTNGEKVKVVNTGETGANMRERPGATAPVVKTVPEGTVLQVIGADQQMDGRGWRNVRDDEGKQGWIVGEFLEAAP